MAIKPLNSVAGFSVGETPSNIILANGDITTTNITTTGVSNLNAIGNVKITGGTNGQVIQTDGSGNLSFITISQSGLTNGTSNINILNSANINFSSAGNANVVVISGLGEYVNGLFSVTGNANIGNIGTAGLITATGNITGGNIITGGVVTATGNGTFGNVITGGVVTATGNGTFGNISTAGVISATGNANVGNLGTTGVYATSLSATANANVGNLGTAGLITASGNIQGANLVTGGVLSVTGNANIGNIGTAGLITASGNITGANLVTGGVLTVTGNANVGNVGTAIITATGNLTAANIATGGLLTVTGNANIGNIGTAGVVTATGNIGGGNINTGGVVSATGNVTGGNLVTAGVLNVSGTGQSNISGNLNMNSKNIISLADPVNPQDAATKQYVDSVAQGLDPKASVTTATAGTLAAASGGTTSYDNGSSGVGATITTTGSFTTISGVNIATVGTRILVKNEANAAWNGIYTYTNTTTLTRSTDFDVGTEMASSFVFVEDGTNVADTGWVCTANTPVTVGTTNITWVQFSGAGTYQAGDGLTLTGTTFSVNTAQPNITSVGTLTSLSVSGNANIGNIGTAGLVTATGNITGGNITTAGLVTATGNITGGNITTAGLANIGSLTVTGTSNLGPVGNVTITGGSSGQYLQTNGSGVLTWTTANTSIIFNGTSNVSIPASDGNVNTSVAGNANVFVVTGTGANLTGTFSASGNANVGNIGTGGLITATGNITGGNLVTTGVVQANTANISTTITQGTTTTTVGNVTTTSTTANQVIATFSTSGVTGVEYLVKGVDSTGSKYSMATVHAVTDGTNVDWAVYGGLFLGATTGSLAVNISAGNIRLVVTPASSNSTVWTTQYKLI